MKWPIAMRKKSSNYLSCFYQTKTSITFLISCWCDLKFWGNLLVHFIKDKPALSEVWIYSSLLVVLQKNICHTYYTEQKNQYHFKSYFLIWSNSGKLSMRVRKILKILCWKIRHLNNIVKFGLLLQEHHVKVHPRLDLVNLDLVKYSI